MNTIKAISDYIFGDVEIEFTGKCRESGNIIPVTDNIKNIPENQTVIVNGVPSNDEMYEHPEYLFNIKAKFTGATLPNVLRKAVKPAWIDKQRWLRSQGSDYMAKHPDVVLDMTTTAKVSRKSIKAMLKKQYDNGEITAEQFVEKLTTMNVI